MKLASQVTSDMINDLEMSEEWSSNGIDGARLKMSQMQLECQGLSRRSEMFETSEERPEEAFAASNVKNSENTSKEFKRGVRGSLQWSRSMEAMAIGENNGSDEGTGFVGDFSSDGSSSDENAPLLQCTDDPPSGVEAFHGKCSELAIDKASSEPLAHSKPPGESQLLNSELEEQKSEVERSQLIQKTSVVTTTASTTVVVVTGADISLELPSRGLQMLFSKETKNTLRSLGKVIPVMGNLPARIPKQLCFDQVSNGEPSGHHLEHKESETEVTLSTDNSTGDDSDKSMALFTSLPFTATLESQFTDPLSSKVVGFTSCSSNRESRVKQSVTLVQYILPSFTFQTTPHGRSVQIALCGPSAPEDGSSLEAVVSDSDTGKTVQLLVTSSESNSLKRFGDGEVSVAIQNSSGLRSDDQLSGLDQDKSITDLYEQWSAHFPQSSPYSSSLAFNDMSRVSLLQSCENSQRTRRK